MFVKLWQVRVLDIENENVTAEDILVLATDGLWDVVSNEDVASIVQRGLTAWDNESRAGRTPTSCKDEFFNKFCWAIFHRLCSNLSALMFKSFTCCVQISHLLCSNLSPFVFTSISFFKTVPVVSDNSTIFNSLYWQWQAQLIYIQVKHYYFSPMQIQIRLQVKK